MDANRHKFKTIDCLNNVMPDLIRHPERIFTVVLVGLCVILLNGCIIPYPHFKETCGPLCGYVVTEDPNVPIENAVVEAYYPDNGHRKTCTDEFGYFSFSTKNRFHWGVLFGVALNHSLPFDEYLDGYAKLNIQAEGFKKRIVHMGVSEWYSKYFDDPNDSYYAIETAGCPIIPLDRKTKKNFADD